MKRKKPRREWREKELQPTKRKRKRKGNLKVWDDASPESVVPK